MDSGGSGGSGAMGWAAACKCHRWFTAPADGASGQEAEDLAHDRLHLIELAQR
jgi:hypothetical protein